MNRINHRLYQWTIKKASRKQALWALALVSCLESALIPIPIEVMTIPLFVANPKRVYRIAWVASVSSVLGGALGYAIGSFFYDSLGKYVIEFYGYEKNFLSFKAQFQDMGWVVVFMGGLTPLPYKIISIASGVAKLNFFVFLWASILSRSLRFLGFALIFHVFGKNIKTLMEQYCSLVSFVVLFCLIGGFILLIWI